MYKNHNWNKKQILQLEDTYKELNKYMNMYKIRDDIIYPKGYKSPSIAIVTDTVEEFLFHRNDMPELIKPVKSFLNKIRNSDTVINLENKTMLLHSYKLLQFVYIYINLFNIQKDGSYKENTFAYYKGDKSRYLKKYYKHCSELKEPDCTEKGSHTIMKFAYLFYNRSNDIIDTFFNQMTLIPIHQYKDFDENSYEMNIIKKSAEFFSSTNFSSYKPLYKSLGIILVSYLTTRMNVTNSDAVKYVNILFDDLFYTITDERYELKISADLLLKNVYITGRLDGIPIFASKEKEEAYSKDILNGIEKLYHDIENDIDIDISFLNYQDYSPLKNLPSIYLNLTPMELLQPYM